MFEMVFSDGEKINTRLHKGNVYKSFYSNKDIYTIAKPPACIILDVVLAKGGPQSIVESYYSTMRHQQQPGGQSDDILTQRTKLSWCLPSSLRKCEDIIDESVKLYHKGDKNIRAHRTNIFYSDRVRSYNVSKAVDRVDADLGRCPFLVE